MAYFASIVAFAEKELYEIVHSFSSVENFKVSHTTRVSYD